MNREREMYYLTNGVMVLSNRELAHYNHNHDKLGRFAKSANAAITSKKALSTPKDYKRQLNRLDRVNVDARAGAMTSEYKASKAKRKGDTTKAKLYQANAKKYRKISQKAANRTKQLGKEAVKKNYDVKMTHVWTHSTSERRKDAIVAVSLIAGSPVRPIIPYLGYYAVSTTKSRKRYEPIYGEAPRKMLGTKYKVSKNKSGGKASAYYTNKYYDSERRRWVKPKRGERPAY